MDRVASQLQLRLHPISHGKKKKKVDKNERKERKYCNTGQILWRALFFQIVPEKCLDCY